MDEKMANSIGNMMAEAMDKIHSMVDANTVVGQPITTADGVTLVPVSRVAFGFASGGNDASSAANRPNVWGGSGAAVKVEPIGFLMIKDGSARMVSIQPPALSTTDRIIDLVPEVMDKIEGYVDKYSKKSQADETVTD
jgi:sporulation protein YtfJ